MLAVRTGLKDGWVKMSKADKVAYYKENHALCGDQLAMSIDVAIKQTFSRKGESTFGSASQWLDLVLPAILALSLSSFPKCLV